MTGFAFVRTPAATIFPSRISPDCANSPRAIPPTGLLGKGRSRSCGQAVRIRREKKKKS